MDVEHKFAHIHAQFENQSFVDIIFGLQCVVLTISVESQTIIQIIGVGYFFSGETLNVICYIASSVFKVTKTNMTGTQYDITIG